MNTKSKFKERKAQRKKDFQRSYVHGYEDAIKSVTGRRYVGTTGYNKGFKDSRKVSSINQKYNNYKNQK